MVPEVDMTDASSADFLIRVWSGRGVMTIDNERSCLPEKNEGFLARGELAWNELILRALRMNAAAI